MNSAQINGGKHTKRTRDRDGSPKAQALLEPQERKQNPFNGRFIMDLIEKYNDLVASIDEYVRMENVKTTLQNFNHEKTDIEACWVCRKGGCTSRCRCRKSATQMVKKMIMNNATACSCYEVQKNFSVQELQKGKNNDSTPTKEMCKREETGSGSGACWSCRKMGYMTDICKRRSNKIEKEFHQKKRHRSDITDAKKSKKLVLRSCWTCRKKNRMAVCCDCQKNIIANYL